jgi:hypothetical protein
VAASPPGWQPPVISPTIAVKPLVLLAQDVSSPALVNPAVAVTLQAEVASAFPSSLALLWSQRAGPGLNLSDPAVVGTALTSSVLTFQPGALAPGTAYSFQPAAQDAAGRATPVTVLLTTLFNPVNGSLSLSAAEQPVRALETAVALHTAGWLDDNPRRNCGLRARMLPAAVCVCIHAAGRVWRRQLRFGMAV